MVTVVMTTWDDGTGKRFDYALRCVDAWGRNLITPVKHLTIADDGSENQAALDVIEAYAHEQAHAGLWGNTFIITGEHNGIGASLNRAVADLPRDEPWLYTTDDWLLTGTFDLSLPLWLLEQGYDVVRLGPLHPNLNARTRFCQGHGWWLDLDFGGGGFVFATRPFLAAPSLTAKVGLFNEGLDAYDTERLYAVRCAAFDASHPGQLAFAATTLHGPWEHIGDYEVGDRPVV